MSLSDKRTNLVVAIFAALTATGLAQRADSVVTFNEIQYHPAGAGEPEWIELHNQMAVRVDLSGWRLSAGVDFTFPEGSAMEPGGWWVVASDPAHPSLSGVENVFGPFTGRLDNGGETLRLRGRHGRVMDELGYRDGEKWPAAPDGGGVTLAKVQPETASGQAESWSWSEQAGGTPGGRNFNQLAGEVLSEVIHQDTVWRFDPSGGTPDPSWQQVGFDDSGWPSGVGSFATALVQNPSFEAETFSVSPGYVSANSPISSWQTLENGATGGESRIGINTPGDLDPFANNGAPPHGSNVAFIRGGVRALVQEVTGFQPGTRYLLSYRENGRSPTNPVGSATLGRVPAVPQHPVAPVESLGLFTQPYHHQVGAVFTATSETHQLFLSNHAGLGDSVLYDAVRIDPVDLYHPGAGAAALHRSWSTVHDTVVLRAEVDPGAGGDGVSLGFKTSAGSEPLSSHGVLWVSCEDSGEVVLRAEEEGGNHIVALATNVAVQAGSVHQVAIVWKRAAGRVSVLIDQQTIFNQVDLHTTAGGSDGRFDPGPQGVSALFNSTGGNLVELAVAGGRDPATTLPLPVEPATYRFRTEFMAGESSGGTELLLSLKNVGSATLFLNGSEIHRSSDSGSSEVLLPGAGLQAGANALAVELSTLPGESQLGLGVALTTIQRGGGNPRPPLRLSEISRAGAPDFFVEVVNQGSLPLNLSDYSLNGTALPGAILAPGAARAIPAIGLGFAPVDEEILFLRDSSGVLLDAERAENRLRAYDEASASWQHPAVATPGAANSFEFDSRLVINEIHYHNRPTYADPNKGISYAENDLEWIELFNRSGEEVDLTGWSLRDAVSYDFPAGSMLAAGGYLVITNAEFAGALNNRRDRVHLRDGNDNTVDVVEYLDGAPWPEDADGGGSSLELRHPDADNRAPGSWAASEEGPKAVWQNYRYRGRGIEPPGNNNPGYFHEFLMGMLAAGEVLVDDLSVMEDPDGAAVELIQNGGFERDRPGLQPVSWRILGNHQSSEVVVLPEGGRALKLVASGSLEHSYNLASTTFAGGRRLNTSKAYEISFRAKWLSGSPQLNTRLYFNRLSRTHILPQPAASGTPGAPNSTLVSDPPPVVSEVRHAPVVPGAGEPVRIHAHLEAPDGIGSAIAHFEAGEGWSAVPMSGTTAGDYVAILPAQPAGAVVQFYVEAIANSGAPATFPAAGAEARALFRVGDRTRAGREVPTIRLIVRPEEAAFMHTAHHTPSNHRVGATVIYNDREVWYEAGIRLRGSPYGRRGSRVGWNVKFPADRPFRGVHDTVAIDGGFSVPRGDGSGWIQVGPGVATNELVYNQMAGRAGGVPASHDDVVYIEAPRPNDDKLAQLKMARFGDIWKASSFSRGDEGSSFKFELVYHPRTTIDGRPESLKSVYDAVLGVDIRDMGPEKEAYRHNFWIQNQSARDDYGPVISAGAALSESATNLRAATEAALDVDNWLRVMAFQSLTMTVDSYNNGLAHNMLLYGRPSDGKVIWIPWDVDHAFYASPSTSLFGLANGDFARVVQIPANRRAYCGHLLDLCSTGFNPAYIADWVTHFNAVGEMPIAAHYTQWITDRRNFVLAQLRAVHPAQAFRITTNGGSDFSVAEPLVTVRGKGWIDVREIRLGPSGEALNVHWIDNNDWEVVVPLGAGANTVVLTAVDHGGASVGSDIITVTNTGGVEPASATNLVISELMYHAADPTPAEVAAGFTEGRLFDYLELENIGPLVIDLGGVGFTEGVAFDFSTAGITQLAPGERLLIVQNQSAFEWRQGQGHPVAGEFQGATSLANGGERLRLEDAGGGTIRDFSYRDAYPWPEDADGGGYSLVLLDPATNPDHSVPENWRLSAAPGGNPGATDAVVFVGDPAADDDGDGLSNFMNFALGGSGASHAPSVSFAGGVLSVTHTRNLAAAGVRFFLDLSSDLVEWSPSAVVPVAESALGNGNSVLTWELAVSAERRFLRLRVEGR